MPFPPCWSPDSIVCPLQSQGEKSKKDQKEREEGEKKKGVVIERGVPNKPIGASPGRDYVLTRMVLQVI
jgi:hypothetical protein